MRYEGYFNGADRESIQTSMSVAKSFLSAVVGVAIDQGHIGSVDDPVTDHVPDLRAQALERTEVVEEPGRLHYNNYNPLLLGLVLERATGVPVATYLERELWQPLGAEADASWSLDGERSGFEKLESGVNARAIDFARFGALYTAGAGQTGRSCRRRGSRTPPTSRPGPRPRRRRTSSTGGCRTIASRGRCSHAATTASTFASCPRPAP